MQVALGVWPYFLLVHSRPLCTCQKGRALSAPPIPHWGSEEHMRRMSRWKLQEESRLGSGINEGKDGRPGQPRLVRRAAGWLVRSNRALWRRARRPAHSRTARWRPTASGAKEGVAFCRHDPSSRGPRAPGLSRASSIGPKRRDQACRAPLRNAVGQLVEPRRGPPQCR